MTDYIKDDSNEELPHIKKYKEEFGNEPIIIGLFWNNPEETKKRIKKAIETGKPYNEYELLTPEEQKAFDAGELVF